MTPLELIKKSTVFIIEGVSPILSEYIEDDERITFAWSDRRSEPQNEEFLLKDLEKAVIFSDHVRCENAYGDVRTIQCYVLKPTYSLYEDLSWLK